MLVTYSKLLEMSLSFPHVGGWAIPRKDLIKKSPIGKGEFGGKREGDRGRERICY